MVQGRSTLDTRDSRHRVCAFPAIQLSEALDETGLAGWSGVTGVPVRGKRCVGGGVGSAGVRGVRRAPERVAGRDTNKRGGQRGAMTT